MLFQPIKTLRRPAPGAGVDYMKNIIITYVPPNRMLSNFANIYICSMYSRNCTTLGYGNIGTPTLYSRDFKLKKSYEKYYSINAFKN